MKITAYLSLGPLIIAIIVNALLTLLVFFNNPKNATNKIYSILSMVISIWLIVNYLSLDLNIIGGVLLWIRLTIFFATPMSALFFLLAYTIPDYSLHMNRKVLWLLTIITACVMAITLSPFTFTSIKIVHNSVQPIAGPGMLPFTLLTTFYSIATIYVLIKKYHRAIGYEKEQFRYVMLGILLMLGLIIATLLIPVLLFKTTFFVSFLPLYTLIFLSATAYAIIKHHLLDIRLVVARSAAYGLILLILAAFYTFYLLFVGTAILAIPFSQTQFVFYGVVMFIVAFTFHPLKTYLELFTDRIFYKGHYDQQVLLKSLSDIMSATIELKKLTTSILDNILKEMRITRGAFVLFKKNDHGYINYIESKGYNVIPHLTKIEINLFLSYKQVIIFDNLEENDVKTLLRSLNISIILPLMIHDEKIGILFFGEKASGDIYSQQDINLLEILAPQLSVAIQNAREYEEIKQFNVTLKEEIDKATKELQNANERLKELDKLKNEFVSLASHELRTPMTAIKSYIWLLLQQSADMGKLNDKQKLYLERTYTSTERLIKLVNDMLNVSRIESGKLKINIQSIDMLQMVHETITELLPSAQNLHITLSMEKPAETLPNVLADPEQIKEVLLNLIGNALKFTPEGGKVTVNFSLMDHRVVTHVSDTGKGIRKEDMPKLFQKFSIIEGDSAKKPNLQGTGLGLYISKSLIELQGGKIWVTSEGENKGTTFSFSLKPVNNATAVLQEPLKK